MAVTLFDRCGGTEGVSRLVMALYDRVLSQPRLAGHFADTDMPRLVDHHAKFLSTLLGGPVLYDEGPLLDAHAGLPIADADFDALLAELRAVLAGSPLRPDEAERVVARYEAYRSMMVGARSG
jgi:hemoglobin